MAARRQQHLGDRPAGGGRPRQVALVDDEHVRDLHRAALDRLDAVAQSRRRDQNHEVRVPANGGLRLPRAHGFDQNPGKTRGIEQIGRRGGGLRQPAAGAARGHRPDEDARIGLEVGHANPVAEHGAAGQRTRRIEGEHRHRLSPPAEFPGEGGGQGALADAGRPGQTDRHRPPGAPAGRPRQGPRPGAPLDRAQSPAEPPGLAPGLGSVQPGFRRLAGAHDASLPISTGP